MERKKQLSLPRLKLAGSPANAQLLDMHTQSVQQKYKLFPPQDQHNRFVTSSSSSSNLYATAKAREATSQNQQNPQQQQYHSVHNQFLPSRVYFASAQHSQGFALSSGSVYAGASSVQAHKFRPNLQLAAVPSSLSPRQTQWTHRSGDKTPAHSSSHGLDQYLHRSEISINLLEKMRQLEQVHKKNQKSSKELAQNDQKNPIFDINGSIHITNLGASSPSEGENHAQHQKSIFGLTTANSQQERAQQYLSLCNTRLIDEQRSNQSQYKKKVQDQYLRHRRKHSTRKTFDGFIDASLNVRSGGGVPDAAQAIFQQNNNKNNNQQLSLSSASPRDETFPEERQNKRANDRFNLKNSSKFGFQHNVQKNFHLDQLMEDLLNASVSQAAPPSLHLTQNQATRIQAQPLGHFSQILQREDDLSVNNDVELPESMPEKIQDIVNQINIPHKSTSPQGAVFQKNVKIRADGMIYNVKQLLRLQSQREKLILKQLIKPEEMIDYVRKRNQIQILLENSKKIKSLKDVANLIETEIQTQNLRINDIISQLISKFNLSQLVDELNAQQVAAIAAATATAKQ